MNSKDTRARISADDWLEEFEAEPVGFDNSAVRKIIADYKATEAENAGLREKLDDWEEREAKVCPEDVGFEEYIKALHKKLDPALTRERELSLAYERMRGALTALINAIPSRAYGYSDDEERVIEIGFEKVVENAKEIVASSSPSEYAKRVRDVLGNMLPLMAKCEEEWGESESIYDFRILLSKWKGE